MNPISTVIFLLFIGAAALSAAMHMSVGVTAGLVLAGVFLGRWLDRRFDAGIFWTGALLVVGLVAGCAVAWRRVQEIQREDEP